MKASPSMLPTRVTAILAMMGAAVVGLLSRTDPFHDLPVVGSWAGDTAWAVAAYFLVRLLLPAARIRTVALLAATVCLTVELTQLIPAEWLKDLRRHRIVALLIGRGFLWIDLLRYALGVVTAMGVDWILGPGPPPIPSHSRPGPRP